MIERWHRQLKSAIKCLATEKWVEAQPAVLFGIQCSLKEDLKCSAAELVFGNTLHLLGKKSVISVDRLKPAFVEIEDPVQLHPGLIQCRPRLRPGMADV
ncbi:hypothetical protein TNCT_234691 [Trichonephila clavata]|uniref:Uncharacterized protein n=1 Tax=Trichonephila clavata TaxID=2740835 RepID=A0A8X6K4S1_TRICU|nr:hypothetical protein TNCT_234691 [Trichonephila clavata]